MENVELPLEETPERKRVKRLWFWIAIAAVACFVGLIALGIVATLVVPNVLQKFAMASQGESERGHRVHRFRDPRVQERERREGSRQPAAPRDA